MTPAAHASGLRPFATYAAEKNVIAASLAVEMSRTQNQPDRRDVADRGVSNTEPQRQRPGSYVAGNRSKLDGVLAIALMFRKPMP